MSRETGIDARAFAFSPANAKSAKAFIAKYPDGRQASAVMPLLDLAQRQNDGWLTKEAMDCVAGMLEIPVIRVYEVATFYSMYNLAPVGKNYLQVCTTTPCWLRGSDKIVSSCRKILDIGLGETTKDGEFTLGEVECLGACVNAPVLMINDDYFEDLDSAHMESILTQLKLGGKPQAGSKSSRRGAALARDSKKARRKS